MKTNKGFTTILAIIIGLLVIGGGSYFYLNTDKDNGEEVVTEDFDKLDVDENNETDNNTNTKDDTQDIKKDEEITINISDWETYTNDALGYSISYPAGWLVEDDDKSQDSIVNPERAGKPDTGAPREQFIIRMINDNDICNGDFNAKLGGYLVSDSGWTKGYGLIYHRTICRKLLPILISISVFDDEDGKIDEESKNIFETILSTLEFTSPTFEFGEETALSNLIKLRSAYVLTSFNQHDMETFKKLIHPVKGVRFSKDGIVFLENDLVFTPEAIDKTLSENPVLLWGYADGSGKPINKTFRDYISQYSEINYLKAPQIAYNEILRGGSAGGNNVKDKYSDNPFVSYHYPYTSTYTNDSGEEVVQPMSWTTLNLVFEEYQGIYYLVGIVQDNWTI